MSVMKEKLHVVDSSGTEATFRLFSSTSDWSGTYNASPCLHVITEDNGEGVCPLTTSSVVGMNLKVCYNGTDYTVVYPTNRLGFTCTNSSSTSGYTTVYKKTITKIFKTIKTDYDIKVYFCNGSGNVLYSYTLKADTMSVTLSQQISSNTGFTWYAVVPATYVSRTLRFSKLSINCPTAFAQVKIPAFTVTANDYDGTAIATSRLYIHCRYGQGSLNTDKWATNGSWTEATLMNIVLVAVVKILHIEVYLANADQSAKGSSSFDVNGTTVYGHKIYEVKRSHWAVEGATGEMIVPFYNSSSSGYEIPYKFDTTTSTGTATIFSSQTISNTSEYGANEIPLSYINT